MYHRVRLIEKKSLLLEYSREIEAKKLAPKLIQALWRDESASFGNDRALARPLWKLWGAHNEAVTPGDELTLDQMNPEDITQAGVNILAVIELADPTPNKMYMQWLGRMYARGDVKMEDLNRQGLLSRYHQYKLKKKLRPEHTDINQFKNYEQFEATVGAFYRELENPNNDKGVSKKVYDDATVQVVMPEDESAACYYGRGTRWCTAGRENNKFDSYHSRGPLYIFLPKKPKYPTEKYQLHVSNRGSLTLMDDEDEPVDLIQLKNRFPMAWEHMLRSDQQFYAALDRRLLFMSDDTLRTRLKDLQDTIAERLHARCDLWDTYTNEVNTPAASAQIRKNIPTYVDSVSVSTVRSYVGDEIRMESEWEAPQLVIFFKDPDTMNILYTGRENIPIYMQRAIDADLSNLTYDYQRNQFKWLSRLG